MYRVELRTVFLAVISCLKTLIQVPAACMHRTPHSNYSESQ